MKFSVFGLSFEFGFSKKEPKPSSFQQAIDSMEEMNKESTKGRELSSQLQQVMSVISGNTQMINRMMSRNNEGIEQQMGGTMCNCPSCTVLRDRKIDTESEAAQYIVAQVRSKSRIHDLKVDIEEQEEMIMNNVNIARERGIDVEDQNVCGAIDDIMTALTKDLVKDPRTRNFENVQPPNRTLH